MGVEVEVTGTNQVKSIPGYLVVGGAGLGVTPRYDALKAAAELSLTRNKFGGPPVQNISVLTGKLSRVSSL